MSAIRSWNPFTRNERRKSRVNPYTRVETEAQAQQRQKGENWSLFGMFDFIAKLRGTQPENRPESVSEEAKANIANASATGDATPMPDSSESIVPHTPTQPVASGSGLPSTSPNCSCEAQIEQLKEWVEKRQKDKSPVNILERIGMQALMDNDKPKDRTYNPESFRFSSTPAPARSPDHDFISPSPARSPPRRGKFSGHATLPTFRNNSASAARKKLDKDPNGAIRWNGAGSARATPARTRRSTYSRATSQDAFKAENTKRRRVGEDKDDPGSMPGMSASQSAPVFGSGGGEGRSSPSKFNVKPLPRSSIRPKTAPAVPSPLRQVVSGASPPVTPGMPPSQRRVSNTGTNTDGAQTPTRAAMVLSEMLVEVTPPPKPDIANPYQTASPVKHMTRPKEKRRVSERKVKEAEKKEKEQEKKMEMPTPKAIIEATVPKGAKRSRPPPGLGKSRKSPIEEETRVNNNTPTIEEEPEEKPSPKKKFRTVTIEEVEDDDMAGNNAYTKPSEIVEPVEPTSGLLRPSNSVPSNASTSPLASNGKASVFGASRTSLPKAPSKLRTSFIAEEDENEILKPAAASVMVPSSKPPPNNLVEQAQKTKEPKDVAMEMSESTLPVYVFNMSVLPDISNHKDARSAALAVPVASLPTFDFSKPLTNGSSSSSAPKAFDYAASGMKPAAQAAGWTCAVCMLQNPSSAVEKCTICDAPRLGAKPAEKKAVTPPKSMPIPPAAPAVKAFDWAAAGVAPPKAKSGGDSWSCSTCMLTNPASATEKCTVCDAPR